VDYLLKPPKLTALIRAIERALAKRRIEMARKRYQKKLERKVRDRTAELRTALRDIANTYQNTLLALVAALDAREHETSDHSLRVVSYTSAIAQRLSIGGKELEEIGRGALLHDIGKIGVPDAVLLKPGKLTPDEWLEMRKHPDIGFQMIQNIPFLDTPAQIVLSHQERWDGAGYPRTLQKHEIHIGARIFAVADTLDAMTSDRPQDRDFTAVPLRAAKADRCAVLEPTAPPPRQPSHVARCRRRARAGCRACRAAGRRARSCSPRCASCPRGSPQHCRPVARAARRRARRIPCPPRRG
jgi:putative nucleotidyltransferase with HDIG domain